MKKSLEDEHLKVSPSSLVIVTEKETPQVKHRFQVRKDSY